MTRDEKSNEQVKCRIKIKEFLKEYQNCGSQPFLWRSMLTLYSNYVCQAICTAYFGMDSNGAFKISASINDLMGTPIEETATEQKQSNKEIVELLMQELNSCTFTVSWTSFLYIDRQARRLAWRIKTQTLTHKNSHNIEKGCNDEG